VQNFQQTLAQVGVRLACRASGRRGKRVTSAISTALQGLDFPAGSDPFRWHSSQVGVGTANECSFGAPDVDRLTEAYVAEIDPERRGEISRELHRRLYAEQAYLYGVKVPHKFAIDLRIRNVRLSAIDPGYRVRDWYRAE
jgi:hypothetical protein